MKLSKLYELIVKYGIQQDPRGKNISEYFLNIKKEYRALKGVEKQPLIEKPLKSFSDTRVLYGDRKRNKENPGRNRYRDRRNPAGRQDSGEPGLDLALSHHPKASPMPASAK